MLVATFDSEANAYHASRALEELHQLGAIAVNASAVITRNQHGETSILPAHHATPQAALGGAVIGMLIGVFWGFAGAMIGWAVGLGIGALADFDRARGNRHFAAYTLSTLPRGKAAVVAQIDEDSVTPLDTRLAELGGAVTRRDLTSVEDADYVRQRSEGRGRLRRRVNTFIERLLRYSM